MSTLTLASKFALFIDFNCNIHTKCQYQRQHWHQKSNGFWSDSASTLTLGVKTTYYGHIEPTTLTVLLLCRLLLTPTPRPPYTKADDFTHDDPNAIIYTGPFTSLFGKVLFNFDSWKNEKRNFPNSCSYLLALKCNFTFVSVIKFDL